MGFLCLFVFCFLSFLTLVFLLHFKNSLHFILVEVSYIVYFL